MQACLQADVPSVGRLQARVTLAGLLVEDAFDDGGLLGGAGPEVPAGVLDRRVAEQGLDLGGVGAALPQSGGVGVAQPVRSQVGDAGVGADCEDHLGDAGDGQRASLSTPQRAGLAAARFDPGPQCLAGPLGDGDLADLVAFAVQPQRAGSLGDRDVGQVEAGAFLHPSTGGAQHLDDRVVADAAAPGGPHDAFFGVEEDRYSS